MIKWIDKRIFNSSSLPIYFRIQNRKSAERTLRASLER